MAKQASSKAHLFGLMESSFQASSGQVLAAEPEKLRLNSFQDLTVLCLLCSENWS